MAVRGPPLLDPSSAFRLRRMSGPAPGDGITLTLLGEPTTLLGESSTLALSRLGAGQRRTFSIYDPSRERGLDSTPQIPRGASG